MHEHDLPPFSHGLNGWFMFYVRRYLRRHFHAVRLLRGAPDHPDIGDKPVIFYSNHPSWWDPLVFLTIGELLYPRRMIYGPIDATALGKYRFMERIGFIGIDPGTWRGSARFLRMARAAERRSDVIFWITAQGEFVDPRDRPVTIRPGVAHALEARAGGLVVPLAVEYPFWTERFPEALAAFGPAIAIADSPGLTPGGLHVYDGQNHQRDRSEREAAVARGWSGVAALCQEIDAAGLPLPRIVAGGTGSFPIYAAMTDPRIELSPGTVVFHDAGYRETFPDLRFVPAALLLTRCISRPTPERATFDLGYKAVASDPPAGNRLSFPDLPDAKAVLQNEEHLVLETGLASSFAPGDELLAMPRHVCPTSALHKQVYIVHGGEVVARWDVVARDRWLTI